MKPKGIENVETIIAACQKTMESLEPDDKAAKDWLSSAIGVLEQMKDKFFLKTNPAVPVTNRCRRDAEELQSAAGSGDKTRFAATWEQFKKDMDDLLKRSSMEGVIIT